MTFKEWKLECVVCDMKDVVLCWDYELPRICPECLHDMSLEQGPSRTVMIATDDIPGGYTIHHGLCNEDGSPRKYYSKTEIKREANKRGLTISGDTPKPYRV